MAQSLVVGAGGVGLLLQHVLQDRAQSILLTRPISHVALSHLPLRITGVVDATAALHTRKVDSLDALPPDATVFIAVRARDLPSLLEALRPHLGAENTVVLCQSGIGVAALGRTLLPGQRIFRLHVDAAIQRVEPAHIHITDIHGFELTGPARERTRLAEWQEVLGGDGLHTRVDFSMEQREWQHALWRVAVDGLAAVEGVTFGGILQSDGLRQRAEALALEAVEIAQLAGLTLDASDVFGPVAARTREVGETLLDLRQGRGVELGFLNGAVVELARRHGREAPLNAMLLAQVETLARSAPNAGCGGDCGSCQCKGA